MISKGQFFKRFNRKCSMSESQMIFLKGIKVICLTIIIRSCICTLDMINIDRQLIQSFGRIKIT